MWGLLFLVNTVSGYTILYNMDSYIDRLCSFFPTPRFMVLPAIGIDISDQSIKWIELKSTSKGVVLSNHGKKNLEKGIVEKGKIVNKKKLVEILKIVQKESDNRFVHVSLPEEHGYLFKTDISSDLDVDQIHGSIEFNLKENVPLSPDQAVFDYVEVPKKKIITFEAPFEEKKNKKTEDVKKIISAPKEVRTVSVSAYPKAVVENYIDVFSNAGFKILSLEIEARAITRSVIPKGDDGTYMIIDIGRSQAGLSIVNRGVVLFTSTLDVGGDDLTVAIEKAFSVSYEEAEVMKNKYGFINSKENEKLFSILFSAMSVLRDEVKKHYTFWEDENKDKDVIDPIERILLCGGNANLAGLPEYLSVNIGVPAERADVWINNFSFDGFIPEIDQKHSLEYATAIGLALRSAQKYSS